MIFSFNLICTWQQRITTFKWLLIFAYLVISTLKVNLTAWRHFAAYRRVSNDLDEKVLTWWPTSLGPTYLLLAVSKAEQFIFLIADLWSLSRRSTVTTRTITEMTTWLFTWSLSTATGVQRLNNGPHSGTEKCLQFSLLSRSLTAVHCSDPNCSQSYPCSATQAGM